MVDGMNCVMTCISSWKHPYNSKLSGEQELLKGKSISSEESQLLGDECIRLIGGLSNKIYDIYDSDIYKKWIYIRDMRKVFNSRTQGICDITLGMCTMTVF